jgi:hypothetical protein
MPFASLLHHSVSNGKPQVGLVKDLESRYSDDSQSKLHVKYDIIIHNPWDSLGKPPRNV